MASAIHQCSTRASRPFIRLNCAALPADLVEGELFGWQKGAFTGANKAKKGLMELADGGTVFLDEIGELPLSMQAKLLTFLEDRRFKRVGGLRDIEVNVRIIAATNRDLEEEVEKGTFREDLFYRLNVMQIRIPPCGSGGRIFRCWPGSTWSTSTGNSTSTSRTSTLPFCRRWRGTTGRAMCGS